MQGHSRAVVVIHTEHMPKTEESTHFEVRAASADKRVSRFQRAKLAASKAAASASRSAAAGASAASRSAAAGATAAKKITTRKKKPPPEEIGLYDLPSAPPPTTPQRPSPEPPAPPREEAKEPPAPEAAREAESPKEKLSRKERKRREDAATKAAAADLAKKTKLETRETRERRYRREIEDARRSLAEQKEMWLGLVKDSEQQCRDLELEVGEVRREEAALTAQLDDVRRNDDGAVDVLTSELVSIKLRAAELANECDMLDHHATLVRRQKPR